MKILLSILCFVFIFEGCTKNQSRVPASEYTETDEPVALAQIKVSTFERLLDSFVQKSDVLTRINHFEMDPLTRIININFTVNYPLENLFNFIKSDIPKIDEEHEIEVALSLPSSKSVAYTRYLGLTFHKLKIDGDDYINTFEIVAAVAQTVLANSNLIDYLYVKNKEQIKSQTKREILKEIIEDNGIVIFHTTKKINFKLDLSKFSQLNSYIEDYENVRLWSFSPSLFQGKEPRFKIIAGEGRPSELWMKQQLKKTKADDTTLLQVREKFFNQYSDHRNINIVIKNYQSHLLSQERIDKHQLPPTFKKEIHEIDKDLLKKAQQVLTVDNDNFLADPEYEYLEFINYSKRVLRNSVSSMDKRLAARQNILNGGDKNSSKMPMLSQYISQSLINGGVNALIDLKFEEKSIFKEVQVWPMPQLPGVQLRGVINLPVDYLLSKFNTGLTMSEVNSKLIETEQGVPFKLTLRQLMEDNGKLQLDIKSLEIFNGTKSTLFTRKSKNQALMFDLVKIFLAQSLSSLEYESSTKSEKLQKRLNEIRKIQKFVIDIKKFYSQNRRNRDFSTISQADVQLNPFISAGADFVETKKKILLNEIIRLNPKNGYLEVILNPELILDDVNNIDHNLTVWGVQPVYSKELDNTYIKLDVGHSTRSNKYINTIDQLQGLTENSEHAGVYYDLNKKQIPADALMTIDFKYLESYINYFLSDVVNANKLDLEEQAEGTPGETFYEIAHMDLKISQKKELQLDLKIRSAKKGRNWYAPWTRSLKEDTYSLKMDLILKSKEINLDNSHNNLVNLKYYKNAISINPTKIKVTSGSRNILKMAVTSILNSTVKLGLNNRTIKKLLLHIANKFLKRIYGKKNKNILGHRIEKRARLYTTNTDLLLFLNPRFMGAAFDVHLANNDRFSLFDSINVDPTNQKVHMAFTGNASMAKVDKLELMNIVKEAHFLVKPFIEAKSAKILRKLLRNHQLIGKLITNSDKSKLSLYNRYLSVLRKYDQVLHTVKIPHQSIELKSRISASGAELMYFAGASSQMHKQIKLLTDKMKRYKITDKNSYYRSFIDAQRILDQKVTRPLVSEYQVRNHDINQTIIKNKISYWTFLFYADAYFSESVYRLVSQ
jgi:hypothetical protein